MNILTVIRLLIAIARTLEIPPHIIASYWNDVDGNQVYFDKLVAIVGGDVVETEPA